MILNSIIFLAIFTTILILSFFFKNDTFFVLQILSIIGVCMTILIAVIIGTIVTKKILIKEVEPTSVVKSDYNVYVEFGDEKMNFDSKFMYDNVDSIQFYSVEKINYFNASSTYIKHSDVYKNVPKDTILLYDEYFN